MNTTAERLINQGLEQGLEEGKIQGIAQGFKNGQLEAAKKMLQENMPVDLIKF